MVVLGHMRTKKKLLESKPLLEEETGLKPKVLLRAIVLVGRRGFVFDCLLQQDNGLEGELYTN